MKELVAFQSHRKSLGSLGWAAIRRACTLIKLQNTGCGHSKLLDVFFACKILDKKKNQKMKLQMAPGASGTLGPACDLLRRKRMCGWLTEARVRDLKWIIP